MSNLHTPERGADESFADYKERRAASHHAVKAMRLQGIGNQHKAPSSRESLRDAQRKNGTLRGIYGASLMSHYARRMASASAANLQRRALA